MSIFGELQHQNGGAWVTLFVLDATAQGGAVTRFHAGTNGLQEPVVWQGETFDPYPIQASGFEVSGQQLPRPKLVVANVSGLVSAMLMQTDLLGAKVTRKRTMVKYLDAVNFPGSVNPDADPNMHLADDVYYVAQKTNENAQLVEFELGSPIDLEGVTVPRRQIIANLCMWRYRGEGCGYAGGAVADANDNPTGVLALDRCSKKLSGCKLRFGEYAELPFGGFPASGLVRI